MNNQPEGANENIADQLHKALNSREVQFRRVHLQHACDALKRAENWIRWKDTDNENLQTGDYYYVLDVNNQEAEFISELFKVKYFMGFDGCYFVHKTRPAIQEALAQIYQRGPE